MSQNQSISVNLEKALVEWCDANLKPKKYKHHPLDDLEGVKIKYSSCTNPKITPKMIIETGKLVYQDNCECSGYYSGYDVYLFPNGTYRVVSCDSYTDEHDSGSVRFTDRPNIRALVSYLAFKEMMYRAKLSKCCQMLLHKQIGESKVFVMDNDFNDVPKFNQNIVAKKLDIIPEKCVMKNGYLLPDLTKCNDDDVKLIKSIKKQIKS